MIFEWCHLIINIFLTFYDFWNIIFVFIFVLLLLQGILLDIIILIKYVQLIILIFQFLYYLFAGFFRFLWSLLNLAINYLNDLLYDFNSRLLCLSEYIFARAPCEVRKVCKNVQQYNGNDEKAEVVADLCWKVRLVKVWQQEAKDKKDSAFVRHLYAVVKFVFVGPVNLDIEHEPKAH